MNCSYNNNILAKVIIKDNKLQELQNTFRLIFTKNKSSCFSKLTNKIRMTMSSKAQKESWIDMAVSFIADVQWA